MMLLEGTSYDSYFPCTPEGTNYDVYCPPSSNCESIGGGIYIYIYIYIYILQKMISCFNH